MRKSFGVFLAVATLLSMVVMTSPAADAAAATPTCAAAAGSYKWNPTLPLTGKIMSTLTATGTTGKCTGGGVTGGTTTFTSSKTGNTPGGCQTYLKPDPTSKGTLGTFTTKWNNKTTSVAGKVYIKQDPKLLVFATVSGKITSGAYVGKTLSGVIGFKLNTGACTKAGWSNGTYTIKAGTKFTVK